MAFVLLCRYALLLVALFALLPSCCAVPWMICASSICNASLCATGSIPVRNHAPNGGLVSDCFRVANESSWYATIACSETSGVSAYNFFVFNNSQCTLAYTTHDWSAQSGVCIEGIDRQYYATVDCGAASAMATFGVLSILSTLLSMLWTL